MNTPYTRTIAAWALSLMDEITAAPIAGILGLSACGDQVELLFDHELSAPDEALMDSTIAAHSPAETLYDFATGEATDDLVDENLQMGTFIENRTDDPPPPVNGQVWIRDDL